MKPIRYLLLVLIFVVSCKNSSILRIDDLHIDYDYSIDQIVYRHPVAWNPARVFVNSDTICAVVILEDGRKLPYSSWHDFRTVKGLFDEIAKYDTAYYSLKVTMDSIHHYPSSIVVVEKPIGNIVSDVSFGYDTKNYTLHK